MKGRIYVVELPDGPASLLFLTKKAAKETIARQRHFLESGANRGVRTEEDPHRDQEREGQVSATPRSRVKQRVLAVLAKLRIRARSHLNLYAVRRDHADEWGFFIVSVPEANHHGVGFQVSLDGVVYGISVGSFPR